MFDDDDAGQRGRDRITKSEKGSKKLISEEFAFFISNAIDSSGNAHKVVSIEDILPPALYAKAVKQYFTRWYKISVDEENAACTRR